MAVKKKGGFYAVHRGHQTGVYHTWEDAADPSNRATCKAQIDGFPGAVYKKFATLQEAEDFVANGRAPTAASGSTAGGKQATSAQNPRLAVPYQRPSGAGPSVSETSSAKAQAPHPLGGPDVIAWCDGSCLNNGRTDVEVRAGSGVFWEQVPGGPQVPQDIAERLPGQLQTNQRAELFAIARALEAEPDRSARLTIKSDSEYSIKSMTQWLQSYHRNAMADGTYKNSKGERLKNQDLIKYIEALLQRREASIRRGVHFVWVKGHAAIQGNEKADELANAGAREAALPDLDFAGLTAEVSGPRSGPLDVFMQGTARGGHGAYDAGAAGSLKALDAGAASGSKASDAGAAHGSKASDAGAARSSKASDAAAAWGSKASDAGAAQGSTASARSTARPNASVTAVAGAGAAAKAPALARTSASECAPETVHASQASQRRRLGGEADAGGDDAEAGQTAGWMLASEAELEDEVNGL